jgi:hypothetical protein
LEDPGVDVRVILNLVIYIVTTGLSWAISGWYKICDGAYVKNVNISLRVNTSELP